MSDPYSLTPQESPFGTQARSTVSPPTAEELFPDVPYAEDLFPDIPRRTFGRKLLEYLPIPGIAPVEYPDTPAVGRQPFKSYFSEGVEQGFGKQPYFSDRALGKDEEGKPTTLRKGLEATGLLRDVEYKYKNWLDIFNENVLLGVPNGLDFAMRGAQGLVYGVSNYAIHEFGLPKELTPAAYFEAHPLGHATPGYPTTPLTTRKALPPINLDTAADLGLLGAEKPPTEAARDAFTTSTQRPSEVRPPGQEPITEPVIPVMSAGRDPQQDTNLMARALAPDAFRVYDDLVEQKNTIDRQITEMGGDPRALMAEREISAILDRVSRTKGQRLYKEDSDRLTDLRRDLESYTVGDTKEVEFARGYSRRLDADLRKIGPQIQEAHNEVNRFLPRDEADAAHTAEVVDPAVASAAAETPSERLHVAAREPDTGKVFIGKAGEIHADLVTDTARAEMGFADQQGNFLTREEAVARLTPTEQGKLRVPVEGGLDAADYELNVRQRAGTVYVEPDDVVANQVVAKVGDKVIGEGPTAEAALANAGSSAPKPTIAANVARQLEATGTAPEVARASGALVEAYYRTRAALFEGRLGTAQELYEREGLTIRRATPEEEADPRHIRKKTKALNKTLENTVVMFERADATSFMHEQGHGWLVDLIDDSMRENAPPAVKAAGQKMRDWLKLNEGDVPTTDQHEKFARGFERYLMEGQSPTPGMVPIFEQFKQWMIDEYHTVGRLKARINDNIRDMFDQLITEPNRDPVITPEREGAITFSVADAEAATDTPIAEAIGKADEIANTRDKAGAMLDGEGLDAGRRDARRGPEGVGVSGERAAEGGGEPGGQVPSATDERLREGRNPTSAKSESPQRSTDNFKQGPTNFTDKAGNIRIENLDVPEDVAAAIREAAEESGGFLEARRGPLSDVETIQLAEDLGTNPEHIDRWVVGQAFNAEQIRSARQALRESATRVRDAADELSNGGGVAEIIAYAEARERNMMMQRVIAGITAEAGRSLRAFRDMASIKDDALITDFMQSSLNMTPEALKQEAKRVSALSDPQKVNKAVRRAHDVTWKDMAVEGYINSLLSGIETQEVNFVGNLSTALLSPITTGVSATISAIVDPLRGRERAVTFGEVSDRVYAIYSGSIRGLSIAGAILRDEKVGYADVKVSPIEARRFMSIPDVNVAGIGKVPLGQLFRLPSRGLMAVDQFFKAIASDQELAVQARRTARKDGLEPGTEEFASRIAQEMREPSAGTLALVEQHMRRQTFTNELGKFGRNLQAAANNNIAAKMLVATFIRGPANLFKYSVEHSVFGLAVKRTREDIMGKNGEAAQHEAWGRMTTGLMMQTGFTGLTLMGLITGGEPTDPGERETWRNTGKQAYSVNIGGTWYSYRRLDPLGTIVGFTADAVMLTKYAVTNDEENKKLAAMIGQTIYNNLFEKLSMRGATNLVQALIDPNRYGDSYINQLVGSFIPFGGLIGQTARAEDPLMRDTRSFLDSLQARVPSHFGIPFTDIQVPLPWSGREELFPRRDRWGEPIAEENFGPLATRRVNDDFINATMEKLGINKDPPQKTINNVKLNQQQYDDYARLAGRMAKMMLDDIITPEFTQTTPPGIQIKMINHIIDKSREIARKTVLVNSIGTGDDDILQKSIELKLKPLQAKPDSDLDTTESPTRIPEPAFDLNKRPTGLRF